MSSTEKPRCRDLKRGRVDLTCERDEGHEGWHEAIFTDSQEIIYPGSHHVVETREHVSWEPVDRISQAARLLTRPIADKTPHD